MEVSRPLGIVVGLALLLTSCGPAAQPATSPPTSLPAATRTPASSVVSTPSQLATPTPRVAPSPANSLSTEPKRGGTLKVALRGDPPFWDPQTTVGGQLDTRKQEFLVFDSLLTSTAASSEDPCLNKVSPELLESWKWVNDTTLEVKTKQGIRFHNKPPVNGREMTADDIAYSFNRFVQKGFRREVLAGALNRVEVVDRYVARFIVSEPDPALPNRLFISTYGTVAMPKEAEDPQRGFEDPAKSYIGTGPFVFTKYQPGVSVAYDANRSYWQKGLPYIDQLKYMIMLDQATRQASLMSGAVDLITDGIPEPLAQALRRRQGEVVVQGCPATTLLALGMRTDLPPFNDARVRRAMSMAIDRQTIINNVHFGRAVMSTVAGPTDPLFPRLEDMSKDTQQYLEYHPDRARALLAEAGFPNGLETEVLDTRQFGNPYNSMTEAWTAMLANVGIKMNLKYTEYGAYSVQSQGNYPATAALKWSTVNPYEYYASFHSKAGWAANRSRVQDPVIDSYLAEFRSARTDDARKAIAFKIGARLVDQAWQVVMPAHFENAANRTWVKGYVQRGYKETVMASIWARGIWLDR